MTSGEFSGPENHEEAGRGLACQEPTLLTHEDRQGRPGSSHPHLILGCRCLPRNPARQLPRVRTRLCLRDPGWTAFRSCSFGENLKRTRKCQTNSLSLGRLWTPSPDSLRVTSPLLLYRLLSKCFSPTGTSRPYPCGHLRSRVRFPGGEGHRLCAEPGPRRDALGRTASAPAAMPTDCPGPQDPIRPPGP